MADIHTVSDWTLTKDGLEIVTEKGDRLELRLVGGFVLMTWPDAPTAVSLYDSIECALDALFDGSSIGGVTLKRQ